MPETWKSVVGFEYRYEVSDLGRVRRAKDGYVMKASVGFKGYLQIKIGGRCFRVHKLVAEAFLGPRPVGFLVAHNNGDPTDNRLANLRFDTPKSNSDDMRIHGTCCRGEHRWNAVLSRNVVLEIRAAIEAGATQQSLADKFHVGQPLISRIISKQVWAHV